MKFLCRIFDSLNRRMIFELAVQASTKRTQVFHSLICNCFGVVSLLMLSAVLQLGSCGLPGLYYLHQSIRKA